MSITVNGLGDALQAAQSRSQVRNLTEEYVYTALAKVQDELDTYLFKKDQAGIKVMITVYTKVANSYNGVPHSSFVLLEKGTRVWKLDKVYRDRGVEYDVEILNLDKYKEAIFNKVSKNIKRMYMED
jgi:hypothetical protein